MKKRLISMLCAGTMIFAFSGCKSDSVTSGGTGAGGAAATTQTDIAEITSATTTAATATEPLPPDDPEYTVTSSAYIPDEPENINSPDYPVFDERVPLTRADIVLDIEEGYYITSDTDSLTLNVEYIGSAENTDYCFGCAYKLYRWSNELGDWDEVPFGENSAFNALGYIVSRDYPKNSITVSLNDDFYALPLETGSYLVELEIDGITFDAMFEYRNTDSDTGYIIDSAEGDITLTITDIQDDRFVCQLPWPYPAIYEVMCDTSAYDEFCVNDNIEVTYAPMYRIEDYLYRLIPTDIGMSDFELQEGADYKPVIYLYPEKETEVSVKLDYNGTLTITDPYYGEGWNVTAKPDGTLTTANGSVYPYLFWEGDRDFEYDLTEGFCVSGEDTAAFLDEKLSYLGLSDSEIADFCEFWLPHMEKNAYNIITFRGEDYTDNAKLNIAPQPDTVIRVFMTYAPSDEYVEIAPQTLSKASDRSGFTVVEWGGAVLSLE